MAAMPTLRSITLCDSMFTLPACLGEFNLHCLRLGYFKHVNNLPGICVRLTSLETLHIEGCATLHELPTVSLMTSLTSLILHKCALIGLPCLESLTAMWHLSLSDLTPLLQSAPLLSAARLSPFRRSFCPSCACLYCYQFTESSSCRRSVFNWATPVKLCSSVFCMLINCLLHQFLGSIQERVRVPH